MEYFGIFYNFNETIMCCQKQSDCLNFHLTLKCFKKIILLCLLPVYTSCILSDIWTVMKLTFWHEVFDRLLYQERFV
jgi:hypothetical protein